ncbi:MAG: F0F1 ATP synthase subunit A [Brumimicrobium sp.]
MMLTFSLSAEETESHGHSEGENGLTKEEIDEGIDHHLQDPHSFHLMTNEETGAHYGFPLPVILWDDGLHMFMSSAFHHGEELVKSGDKTFMLFHSKIYSINESEPIYISKKRDTTIINKEGKKEDITVTDTISSFSYSEFNQKFIEHSGHLPEESFIANAKPTDFSITKNVFLIIAISLLLFLMFFSAARSYKKHGFLPSGIGRILEPIILFVRDNIAKPNIGEKHYKKYMGFLLTVFFFIWIVNLFGLTPIGVNITNNIAVTSALALMVYLITTFTAKKNYWLHIFWMPGVPVPMKFILAPIELLGTIIKPFSLLIRLYANITAGHIVIMSILAMMMFLSSWIGSSLSFFLAIVLGVLELLVAALQAYIFTMLAALYFGSAVDEGDHH